MILESSQKGGDEAFKYSFSNRTQLTLLLIQMGEIKSKFESTEIKGIRLALIYK